MRRPIPPKKRQPEDQRVHLVVAGSRCFDDSYYDTIKEHLDYFTQDMDDPIILHGGAKGVDKLAGRWAEWNWYWQKVYYPDYEKHPGKQAPLIRNVEMAKSGDYLIVFWNGISTGTKHMMEQMQRLGKHVEVIRLEDKS
jgi:hypothetical protein